MHRLKSTVLKIIFYGLGSYFIILIILKNTNIIDSFVNDGNPIGYHENHSSENKNLPRVRILFPSTQQSQIKHENKTLTLARRFRTRSNLNIKKFSRGIFSSFQSFTRTAQNLNQFNFSILINTTLGPRLFPSPKPTTTTGQHPSSIFEKIYCPKYSKLSLKYNPPIPVPIRLKPSQHIQDSQPQFMLLGILSHPEDRDSRDAIRETWGSYSILTSLNRY